MFFNVVSRTYAEIFSLLRVCSGLLSNSPGLYHQIIRKPLNEVMIFFRGGGGSGRLCKIVFSLIILP